MCLTVIYKLYFFCWKFLVCSSLNFNNNRKENEMKCNEIESFIEKFPASVFINPYHNIFIALIQMKYGICFPFKNPLASIIFSSKRGNMTIFIQSKHENIWNQVIKSNRFFFNSWPYQIGPDHLLLSSIYDMITNRDFYYHNYFLA